jgi:hypothetical protein
MGSGAREMMEDGRQEGKMQAGGMACIEEEIRRGYGVMIPF